MNLAAPVHLEPVVTIFGWAVIHIKGDLRLVGYHADTKRGRVTSPLVEFNTIDMTMRTESGRTYRLRGDEDWTEAWPLVEDVCNRLGVDSASGVGYVGLGDAALMLTPKPEGKPH